MKKFLTLVVVLMAALSVHAQEMYLGGGISLWYNDDADRTSFSISPDFGYCFNEKWAVGAELVYSHDYAYDSSFNAFALAPYARYSFYENKIVRLFVDMGVGVSVLKPKHGDSTAGVELGLKPGMAIKLNNHFSLITRVGFAGYRHDYFRGKDGLGVALEGENISIGIDYEF